MAFPNKLKKFFLSDINKENIKKVYHFLEKKWHPFLKALSEKEDIYIHAIFYLSLSSILLTTYFNNFTEEKVESQLQWLNLGRLEDKYADKYNTASILNPIF